MVRALAEHADRGQPAQLRIEELHEFAGRFRAAAAKLSHETTDGIAILGCHPRILPLRAGIFGTLCTAPLPLLRDQYSTDSQPEENMVGTNDDASNFSAGTAQGLDGTSCSFAYRIRRSLILAAVASIPDNRSYNSMSSRNHQDSNFKTPILT